jgi:imidazolonepropionase-like amidohydrolase
VGLLKMTDRLLLTHGLLFDGAHAELVEDAAVVIENGRICEVGSGDLRFADAAVVDLGGRFLMPGLIDLHFHAYAVSFDSDVLDLMPQPLLVSHAIRHLEGALQRGFTTVRDPGGGDVGLALAIEQGLVNGPRFLFGGKALSQTGGHGDNRRAHLEYGCGCARTNVVSQLVDGADAVRLACREELRKGAHHIKLFITGGVTSPADPIWMPQFTDDEVRAAVEEAASRRKYVAAHCLTDEGAGRCVRLGIRSIEHGIGILEPTARRIVASGTTYVVPTLAVLHSLSTEDPELGLVPEMTAKVRGVLDVALSSLETCARAGVPLGLGTDLFGAKFHPLQSREFELRCAVQPPLDVLRSATSVNAEIVQRSGELGIVAAGACADLIALDASPLEDVGVLSRPGAMPLIVKDGRLVRCDL